MKFNKELFKTKNKKANKSLYLKEGVINLVDIESLYKDDKGNLTIVLQPDKNVIEFSKDYTSQGKVKYISADDNEFEEITLVPIVVFNGVVTLIVDRLSDQTKSKILARYEEMYWGNSNKNEIAIIDCYEVDKFPLNELNLEGFNQYNNYLIDNEYFELLHELKSWNPDIKQKVDGEEISEKELEDSHLMEINEFWSSIAGHNVYMFNFLPKEDNK